MPLERFQHAGLTFEVTDQGAGEAIILLHGFPADRHCWDALTARLAPSFRLLAPEQRGYSPGARPHARSEYRLPKLAADVLALADAAGVGRFHLVGHDWGAAVAWYLAGAHRDRVASLTAVSVPHPAAMAQPRQALHSWYMAAFQVPAVPELLFRAGGGRVFAASLRATGLDAATAARYTARGRQFEGWHGPVAWYRALPSQLRAPARPVTVPTLMIWGPRDRFISRVAAEGARRFVEADYRFVEVPGGDHWLPETEPDTLAAAVRSWVQDHPV